MYPVSEVSADSTQVMAEQLTKLGYTINQKKSSLVLKTKLLALSLILKYLGCILQRKKISKILSACENCLTNPDVSIRDLHL